ncbi:MAG: hydrogenase formation protein HypD [Gammaproteobacteria bacterium]|nr:hydrogenase formation protein HypD [Gammaproteobacteria bacterium]
MTARNWLERIHRLPAPDSPVRIMNVCGGHERTVTHAALRTILPAYIELIPGPGCPVCICPEEAIETVINLGLDQSAIIISFGDMLRVPINRPQAQIRSLEQARAAGADVHAIATPQEAVAIAQQHPDRRCIFLAVGFETTMAPIAAVIAQGLPANLSLLATGRRTAPIVKHLLRTSDAAFNALIAPGHVATIMGVNEWQFIVDEHQLPAAVAGFTSESLLAAIYSILRQKLEGKIFLDNCYADVAKPEGNPRAQALLDQIFEIKPGIWRGIGQINDSAFELQREYAAHDAQDIFNLPSETTQNTQMPAGCDCANVVLGKIYPNECKLFGKSCTPQRPIGPCMVSEEGACHINQVPP